MASDRAKELLGELGKRSIALVFGHSAPSDDPYTRLDGVDDNELELLGLLAMIRAEAARRVNPWIRAAAGKPSAAPPVDIASDLSLATTAELIESLSAILSGSWFLGLVRQRNGPGFWNGIVVRGSPTMVAGLATCLSESVLASMIREEESFDESDMYDLVFGVLRSPPRPGVPAIRRLGLAAVAAHVARRHLPVWVLEDDVEAFADMERSCR